jgi:hypothetical protein
VSLHTGWAGVLVYVPGFCSAGRERLRRGALVPRFLVLASVEVARGRVGLASVCLRRHLSPDVSRSFRWRFPGIWVLFSHGRDFDS